MSKSLLVVSLCLVLLAHGLPVLADDYDDCKNGCIQALAPCIEQAKINAGNIQEEEDTIAACEKSMNGCIQACNDAEAQPKASQQEQPKEQ
jgi:hypothetical protein